MFETAATGQFTGSVRNFRSTHVGPIGLASCDLRAYWMDTKDPVSSCSMSENGEMTNTIVIISWLSSAHKRIFLLRPFLWSVTAPVLITCFSGMRSGRVDRSEAWKVKRWVVR